MMHSNKQVSLWVQLDWNQLYDCWMSLILIQENKVYKLLGDVSLSGRGISVAFQTSEALESSVLISPPTALI